MLLALALIFLPIIFDGNGSYQQPPSSRIPETPIISVLPEPVQSRPLIVGDVEVDDVEVDDVEVSDVEVSDVEVDEPVASEITSIPGNSSASTAEAAPPVEIPESQAAFSREVPALNSAGLPEGWSVRLGFFSNADNASRLMTQLQAAGYKAYTRDMRAEQGILTGVFVGPWLNRGQVNDYQQKLQQEFDLAGLVVRYELENL